MKTTAREALRSVALVLVLILTATACSGSEDDPAGSGAPSTAPTQETEDATSFAIQTTTSIGQQVGKLSRPHQRRLENTITGIVQRWFNAAYVGGDYPRSDFHDAFPGFTPGARDRARQDRLLMSNKGIGKRIDGVTPTRSEIRLDVLAARKRAVGVTARFALEFETSGSFQRTVQVRGRLLLSRRDGEWKIFGYDVSRGGK